MSPPLDVPRLRATLGSPDLSRLVDGLARRIELGRSLAGSLTLQAVSTAERAAIDSLFGRKSTQGTTLRVDLDQLAAVLRDAGVCEDLQAAVRALRGNVIDRRAAAVKHTATWQTVWDEAKSLLVRHAMLEPWLDELARNGFMKRLARDDPAVGAALLRDLARVLDALPAPAEPLAAFAARLLGDAHALDPGSPRAALAVRAAARIGAVPFTGDTEGRRAAWASVGVMCHELSTPVLVLNLPASARSTLGELLRLSGSEGEPVHLSLRMLLRYPLVGDAALCGQDVFVCENPAIVELAVSRLGRRCAPLICVNGQFATPALVLLRQLRDAGAHLHYHGDFDPAGLVIARRVFAETGAQPWRFRAADYLAAPKGTKFGGTVGPTPWDRPLQDAMQANRRIVHEEAVSDELLQDLPI